MVDTETARLLALSLEGAVEHPHFERTSFRVNKKIFATLDVVSNRVCVMLSPVDQSAFSTYDRSIIYPVPNKWGDKGATYIELDRVREEVLMDALTVAYQSKK